MPGADLFAPVEANFAPSPALLEANRRLYARRESAGSGQWTVQSPTEDNSPNTDYCSLITDLPEHLGWGSEAATAAIRSSLVRQAQAKERVEAQNWDWLPPTGGATTSTKTTTIDRGEAEQPDCDGSVKLYPDIALGMLREEQAAVGRVWLLLRHMDREGCGWLRIDIIKNKLTKRTSSLRVCGWRQLRNLLRQGEDIFWHRDKEQVWLRSTAKVAAALGVPCLTGRPVALPVRVLLQSIGDVRAHLYASFHSGRVKETPDGAKAMPIARATLKRISGVGRRSQRAYEQRVGIRVQHNFAIGETVCPEREEVRAWKQGKALFRLTDHRGYQGKRGRTYLAWQLPNSYGGRHSLQPKGRQKRINCELADLFMKGMTGNGREGIERRYYANGALAVKGYGRCAVQEVYWRTCQISVWQVVGSV